MVVELVAKTSLSLRVALRQVRTRAFVIFQSLLTIIAFKPTVPTSERGHRDKQKLED